METLARTRHKLVIGQLLDDPSISIYKAMRAVGYAHNTAIAPTKNLISQPGFQALLEEYLPDSMLLGALHDDIESKKGNRHRELDLAFKVKGRLKPSEEPPAGNTYNTQVNINDNTPRGDQMVEAFTQFMRLQTRRKVDDETVTGK